MRTYSTQQLADIFGISLRTMERRLTDIRKSQQFTKNSPGKLYTETEAHEIASLLNFLFVPKQQEIIPGSPVIKVNWRTIPPNPAT